MTNIRTTMIKKVLTIENLIGVAIVISLAVFGKWIIVLIGRKEMLGAYPLLVILSFGVFVPLTAGAIMNFIFVPLNKYNLITKNQLTAGGVFFICSATGIINGTGMITIPIAMSLAGLSEILFCYYYAKKQTKDENIINV
jgi:PST family polysaccharide transporter